MNVYRITFSGLDWYVASEQIGWLSYHAKKNGITGFTVFDSRGWTEEYGTEQTTTVETVCSRQNALGFTRLILQLLGETCAYVTVDGRNAQLWYSDHPGLTTVLSS